jgi:hypothetical protein
MSGIALAMAVAQRPGVGGHTWVALQYLLGFRAMGLEVTLVDRLEPEFSHDAGGRPCAPADSVNAAYLRDVMEQFGFEDDWALLLPEGETLGLSRREVERRLDSSSLLLNVMGYLEDEDLLARPQLNAFLDIDPGFPQMWRELGLHDAFAGHDRFVTVGLRLGQADCLVPDCGLEWIRTPPPVALDEWPVAGGGRAFTTVASWRGAFGPIHYEGRTFGLRVHEFRRFFSLPTRTGRRFELALEIDPADSGDIGELRRNRWELVSPAAVAGDPAAYREYVGASAAELMVAKNMYVDTRGGWFSDRSACYLASGKPVLAQETGFSLELPTGEGLIAFSNPEEAAAGVEEIAADRPRHAAAAREIAEQHLDADGVLSRLLGKLGVG